MTKQKALAEYLGCELDDVEETNYGFEANGCEYAVLTDEEADAALVDNVRESVWAFTPSFLAEFLRCPVEAVEAIQANDKCESNEATFFPVTMGKR